MLLCIEFNEINNFLIILFLILKLENNIIEIKLSLNYIDRRIKSSY